MTWNRKSVVAVTDPAWFYIWASWGVICSAIIYWIDRSLSASLFLMAVGLTIGRFGEPWWHRLCHGISALQARFFRSSEDRFESGGPLSRHVWMANELLELLNPNKKHWELYLGTALGVGVVHGMLVGTLLGSLSPLLGVWPDTSFVGALLGMVAGPLFVCLWYVVLFPIAFAVYCRGPSIKSIRPLVRAAGEEAARLGPPLIGPGHLLLAMLRTPSGAVERLLRDHSFSYQQVHDFIVAQLPDHDLPQGEMLEDGDCLWKSLQKGIEEAKKLRHQQVDPGHLLLGLVDAWPKVTIEALAMIGLNPTNVREQTVRCLKAN